MASQGPIASCYGGDTCVASPVSVSFVKLSFSFVVSLLSAVWAFLPVSASIVINEIHYNPDVKTEPAEFIELYNAGTDSVNLGGWRFSSGVDYVFSNSVSLAPGAYLVVAQNPAFLATKYSVTGALGPYAGALSKYGDEITLEDAAGQKQDEVDYQLGFPWPTVGDPPGNSIELIHPSLDHNLGGSWRSRLPTPGRRNSAYATNAPPQIRQVEHAPEQPASGQAVRISAKITDPDGVSSVTLQYQVVSPGRYIELTDPAYSNAVNWVSLSMNDAGVNGDLTAADQVFTAMIPASVQVHRRLIRYRLLASDALGNSIRVPYADDPQPNFAYFVYDGLPAWRGAVQPGIAGSNGVVITYPGSVMERLPVYHLIATSNAVATATWFSRYTGDSYLWSGALVYDGKVYDHIHYRARGGVWRYSMCKNMWKFDMNRGHDFQARDNWGRKFKTGWTKVNLGASIQQGDFNHRGEQGMFESLGFRLFQLAGVSAPNTTFVTFRVVDDIDEASPTTQYEGDFWGLYLSIEQEDGRFLEEHGLPDGNFYKMEGGTGTLNNLGPNGPTDRSDLNAFLNTYNSSTNANLADSWWRTNLNLPKYYGYQAVVQSIHHYDIADGKNYFYYLNPELRQWEVCSWDLDLTWADNMYRAGQQGGDEPFKSRVLSNFASPGARPALSTEFRNRVREFRDLLWNSDQAFQLIDEYAALLRGPTNGPTILDADRSMWDYNPKMINPAYTDNPASKAGQGRFYQWPNEPGVPKSFAGCIQLLKNYVGYRATNTTFSLDTMAADSAKPARPTITYTGPSGYPINRLTFRSSSYSGSNPFASLRWRVGAVADASSPSNQSNEPHPYEIETVWDSGPITPFNADITIPVDVVRVGRRYRVRVLHTDTTGRNSQWSLPHEFLCGGPESEADLLNYLRITEVMYHPPTGGYEYVELYNTSASSTLDLSGVKFTQGIDFTCSPGTTLPPGSYLLVVGTTNIAAFRASYGLAESVPVVGAFGGNLSNGGEQLVLRTAAGGLDIVNFNYGDGRGWPAQSDGAGHSLVLLDSALVAQGSGSGEYSGNWRASTYLRGSPGGPDLVLPPGLLLNEVAAHTDWTNELNSNDWIELYNPTDVPITLGPGWYLSDDGSGLTNLMKWAVPSNTVVAARGFVSFDEVSGFHHPTNIGFGLDQAGGQVFLSFLPGNAQDRVVDSVSFKGQETGWSLGRYPDGGPFWAALRPTTRDAANLAPPPRVVLSEVLYHPPDVMIGTNLTDNSLDEFIELHNATAGPIPLDNPDGTWRLNGGIEFNFPTNLTLPADGYLLVVNFNPATNAAQLAAFKSLHAIDDPTLVILGPFGGKLANNSDRIALEKPQHPDRTNDAVSWVIIDEVIYADQSPWPCGSDGSGSSLQRLSALAHGNDPANWAAEAPTAGRPRADLPPGLPVITAQPQDRIVATNANVSFSVSACGSPPFTYQWRFNDMEIAGATNATLNLQGVTPASAGLYRVLVSNPAGSLASAAASLIVQFPPVIAAHPQSTTAIRDQSASFSVTAGGTPPFGYQWRFGLAPIPGATNRVLTLPQVQANQAGNYSVLVYNTAGSALSSNALLTVLIPATVTQQPASRTNRLTLTSTNPVIYAATNATFSVGAVGVGPLSYQWLQNGVVLPGATNQTLMISNVTPAHAGDYTARVTDSVGPALSQPATLTVLVDPIVVIGPVSQSAVAGAKVTMSVSIIGFPPPFGYEWRKGSTPWSSNTSSETTHFFSTNVFFLGAGNTSTGQYRVVIRNVAKPLGTASALSTLLLAPDADGDGLPDDWEAAHGLSAADAGDAALDSDGDGLKNWEEYIAGTDPMDALSCLKVDNFQPGPLSNSPVRIEFNAISNRTYTVLSSDRAGGGLWSRVGDVVAAATNGTARVLDERRSGTAPRFYRLATPKTP